MGHHRSLLAWFNSSKNCTGPTPFWLQIHQERGNENFSFAFADLPLLTEGWLTCCSRKRSMPKCRSCRKDSSGAVKSVQPGCSWVQFLWPANSLVAIYSEVRFLMSAVSNLFCLQEIWQSKKQLLRKAQMLSQNCGEKLPAQAHSVTLVLPAGPQTGITTYFSCSEVQVKHFMDGVLHFLISGDNSIFW